MITSILGIKAPRTDECLPYTVWLWHGHRTRVIVTFFPDHSQISIWSEFVAASSVVSAIEINISRENILRFSQASNYLFIILKKIYFTFIYLFFKWRWYEIRMAEERLNTAGLRKVWQRSVYVLQSVYTGNYKKKKKCFPTWVKNYNVCNRLSFYECYLWTLSCPLKCHKLITEVRR